MDGKQSQLVRPEIPVSKLMRLFQDSTWKKILPCSVGLTTSTAVRLLKPRNGTIFMKSLGWHPHLDYSLRRYRLFVDNNIGNLKFTAPRNQKFKFLILILPSEFIDIPNDIHEIVGMTYQDLGYGSSTVLMGNRVATAKPYLLEIDIPAGYSTDIAGFTVSIMPDSGGSVNAVFKLVPGISS